MTVINTSSFAKALWPGVNAWWGKAYNEFPVEHTKLFDKNTSRKAFEEDVGVSSFGLASIKAEGAPITYDTARSTFISRYTHVVYANGFIITREMFDDDLYDVAAARGAKGLAFGMRQTKETIAANIYNRAFSSSYTGGDGVSLLNASHPNYAGGTWSNVLATASDLSEAALEQACIDISGFTNDRGLKIAVRPMSLHIGPTSMFEASRILKSDGRVGTDNNDLNALKTMGMIPEIVVGHYYTDADAWYIRTDVKDGMKYFERRADEFTQDTDFDTENAKYKATMRFSFGWTDPRALFGSAGA